MDTGLYEHFRWSGGRILEGGHGEAGASESWTALQRRVEMALGSLPTKVARGIVVNNCRKVAFSLMFHYSIIVVVCTWGRTFQAPPALICRHSEEWLFTTVDSYGIFQRTVSRPIQQAGMALGTIFWIVRTILISLLYWQIQSIVSGAGKVETWRYSTIRRGTAARRKKPISYHIAHQNQLAPQLISTVITFYLLLLLQTLEIPGETIESLILKHCRTIQENEQDPVFYSSRWRIVS